MTSSTRLTLCLSALSLCACHATVGTPAPSAAQPLSTSTAVALNLNDPTPEDVVVIADATRHMVDSVLVESKNTGKLLGLSIGVQNAVVKLGQYLGGGGAIIFGLNAASNDGNASQSRNAAYSGAVAAAVTAIEQAAHLDQKRVRRDACKDLKVSRLGFIARTQMWEYKKGNAAFRKDTLPAQHEKLIADVTELEGKCVK